MMQHAQSNEKKESIRNSTQVTQYIVLNIHYADKGIKQLFSLFITLFFLFYLSLDGLFYKRWNPI